jgi:hypothetical protein
VEIVIVRARDPDDHDRTYLTGAGKSEVAAVHVSHDLAHLVVESWFDLHNGLWGEFERGAFQEANRAATARHPRRRKQGRIVSGAAQGVGLRDWLTDEHRLAKAATNSVMNRFRDGPDTPEGVRSRMARSGLDGADELLDRLDDQTIESAILAVRKMYQIWDEVPPGGTLRLTWPLPRSFFGRGAS